MPTYEYSCKKCGRTFEAFQSMKDSAFEICPEEKCEESPWGRGEVKRLLGAGAGLIFKGSGFYITDYRSEGYQKAAKQETGASTGSSSEKSSGGGASAKSDAATSSGSDSSGAASGKPASSSGSTSSNAGGSSGS